MSLFSPSEKKTQYVRILARDTLLLVRGDVHLADQALLPLE